MVERVEQNFPDKPFGYGPPSARFSGCCTVASHAREPEPKEVVRWLAQEVARNPCGKRKAAHDRTDPSWFDGGAALLTLCPPWAGTTMTNACGIQDPQRPIALRTPLLGIEWVIGRITQRSSG